MNNLERLIISLGGVKVNRIKNTTTPSFLYRFENKLYITVEYDKRDQYKSVELGRLFLMKDFFPRLIVLEDFEVLLKAANSIRLPVNYKLKYSMISYDQMIENVVLNLKTVLDNYDKLYELSKPEFDVKEQRLEKHLVKDVSTMSLDEIAKESSQIIYKPKADEINYSKLTNYERKLKEESDMLRSQHNIPKNIYTQFEYNQLQKKKYNFKLRIVLCCLIEFIALSIFIIGLINNHWFVNNGVIYFVFIVTSLALTGLFVLTGLKAKRIEYFLGPALCFFLPFVFMDKIVGTENNLFLTLVTIIVGTLLLSYCMVFEVIKPIKKQNKATYEYCKKFNEKNGSIAFMTREYKPICFYLENGRYVALRTLEDEYYAITVRGSVFYNKVRTTKVPIEHIEVCCSYSEAIKKSIELLQKNDEVFIIKE